MKHDAESLLTNLGLDMTSETLKIDANGARALGISVDDCLDSSRIEASLIGHILLSDVGNAQ